MASPFSRFERITRKSQGFSASVEIIERDDISRFHPFELRNIHPAIVKVSKALFDDGYCSQATFEAFKLVDKVVQKIANKSKSGVPLMMDVFNKNNPDIELTPRSNITERDEQEGYKFLFSGSMLAIRNPRGHEYSISDDPDTCLDHLSLASTLLRRLEKADYEIPAKKGE